MTAKADVDFAVDLLTWTHETERICRTFNPDWRPNTAWLAQRARDYQRVMGYRPDQPEY